MAGLSVAADLTAAGLAGAGAGAPGAAFSMSVQLRVLFLSNTTEVRNTVQFHCVDNEPVFRQLQFCVDQCGALQRSHFLRSRQHPHRPQGGIHRADFDCRLGAHFTRQRCGHPKALSVHDERFGKPLVGKTRRPVGQLDFTYADFPRRRRLRRCACFRGGLDRGGRLRRCFLLTRGKQRLPIQSALDVAGRSQLCRRSGSRSPPRHGARQIQVRLADPRLGKFQHRRATAARSQRKILHD